jgi:hypothetical protein
VPVSFCLSLELLNAFADGIRELLPMLVAIVFFHGHRFQDSSQIDIEGHCWQR